MIDDLLDFAGFVIKKHLKRIVYPGRRRKYAAIFPGIFCF